MTEVTMSYSMEFEDKTIDKAIDKASKELDIPKDRLKYDVISYGSSGIFGLVAVKKAKIRVTAPDSAGTKKTKNHPPAAPKEKKKGPVGHKNQPAGKPDNGNDDSRPLAKTGLNAEEATRAETVNHDEDPYDINGADDEVDDVNGEDSGEAETETVSEEIKELGKETVIRIADLITESAAVTVEEKAKRLLYRVSGGNSAVLIGKKGQTLEAIQYLVEKIVNKKSDHRIRVQVDVEGYLDNRQKRLEKMALRLSEKVKQGKKPVTVGNLNAHDRRIVHLALKGDTNVRTQSMGDGFYRKLVIYPKRNSRKNKPPRPAKQAENG